MTQSLRSQLIGAWLLDSCAATDMQTGEVFLPVGENPEGLSLYTSDGYMSVQLASADRRNFESEDMHHGQADEYMAAGKSYLSCSGLYYVNEGQSTLQHEILVSLFPNWKGQRQLRIIEIDHDRLRLRTDQPILFNGSAKTVVIVWRRAPAII